MSVFYELQSYGASPLILADAKAFMKITSTTDNDLITSMIDSVTVYGEKYTGREFRANTWRLLLDDFSDRIEICRNPIATITHIKYLVSGSQVTIATSVYYLKKMIQAGLILLNDDQSWPTDLDEIEQGIEIEFVTEAYDQAPDQILDALKRHLAHLYINRGDCDTKSAGAASGAHAIYDQFSIARV